MAANTNKIIVDVELRAQLDQMKSGVKELEGLFKGLNLSPKSNASFTNLFADMKKELKEIENLTDGGKIKGGDFLTLEKKVGNVTTLYNKLSREISSLSGKSGKELQKLFPPEIGNAINQATSKLKDYQTVLKQINNEDGGLTQKNSELQKASSNYEKLTNRAKELEETLNKYKNGEIQLVSTSEINKTANKIEELNTKLKQQQQLLAEAQQKLQNTPYNKTNNPAGGRSNVWKEADADVKAYEATIKELEVEIQKLTESFNQMRPGNAVTMTSELERTKVSAKETAQQIETLKNSISELETANPGRAFELIKKEIQEIEGLDLDWNKITNIEELETALSKKVGANLDEVIKKINELQSKSKGNIGNPLSGMAEEVQKANQALQQTESSLNQISQLAQRGLYFFGLTNQVNLFKRAVQSAFDTVKELDKSMTETAVVTDFSVGDMWEQLPQYTNIANEYNATLKDAYDVMTLYYQQGLETNQVFAVGTETMKMARIAGLEYGEATDRMTNALRGFNMEINNMNAEHVADVYSQLAAMSASNVDELSVAMTKVASLANSANMSFDNTAAFLAQIIETTRESAETAGTALKTVVARFSEVKKLYSEGDLIGDVDGEEVNINKVGAALRAAGVDLNEFATGAKGLDEIFIELANKWDSLDLLTQRYIATMAAGSRQQSRFLALMSDNTRLTELLNGAYNASGASSEQFAKTQESLQSKLNNLKNAWDAFLMGITNSDIIKGAVDLLTKLITTVNKLLDVFGKLGSIPKTLASIGLIVGIMKAGSLAIGKFAEKAVSLVGTFGQTNKAASESIGIFTALSQKINNLKLGKGFATDLQVMQNQIKIAEQSVNVLGENISKPVSEAGAVIAFKQIEKGSIEAVAAVNAAGEPMTLTLSNIGKEALETGAELKEGLETGTKIGVQTSEAFITKLEAKIAHLKAELDELEMRTDLSPSQKAGLGFGKQQDIDSLTEDIEQIIKASGPKVAKEGANLGNKFSQGFNKIFNSNSAGITGKIGKVLEKIGGKGIGTGKALGEGIEAGVEGSTSAIGLTGAAAGAAYVAAALGVIAILAAGIYAIWYNATDQASKNMVAIQQEGLSELQSETEALSASVSNLKDNWNSLEESRAQIDNLTQGTSEWYTEVAKLNAEVLKLVDQYSGLDNKLKITSKDGILSIDPDSYKAASEELTKDLNDMTGQTMIMSGLTDYNQAKLNTKDELNNEIEKVALKNMQEESVFTGKWQSILLAGIANANNQTSVGDATYVKSYLDYEAEAKNDEDIIRYQENVADPKLKAAREKAKDQVAQGILLTNEDISETAAQITAETIVDSVDSKASESLLSENMRKVVAEHEGVWGAGGKKIQGHFNIDDELVDAWVKENNYTRLGSQIIDPETGDPIDLKNEKITNAIVSFGANKKIKEDAVKRANIINNALGKNKINDQLAQILAGDASVDLSKGVNLAGLANLTQDEINALLGVESGGTLEQLEDTLFNNIQTIIKDQKTSVNDFSKDLTEALVDSNLTADSLNNFTEALSKYSVDQQMQIADQFNKITELGNQNVVDAYIEAFSSENFDFTKIDTSSLAALRNSLEATGVAAENTGISMSDAFKDFIVSGTLDSMSEQFDELIETNGRITSVNIKELAKSSKELAAQLGYTEEEWEKLARGEKATSEAGEDFVNKTATGLAHVITAVRDGRIEWQELTEAIVAAASATRTQADALAELKGFTEGFDAGTSQLIGREFYASNAESMEKLAEQGAWGDSTFESYLDTVFQNFNPENNEDVKAAYNDAKRWADNPGSFWREANLSTDSSWLEDKTTDKAIQAIIDASGGKVTEEFANSQLQNFLAGTTEGRKTLEKNDINKSLDELNKSLQDGGQQRISESEIETLAKLNNVSVQTMQSYIDAYNKDHEGSIKWTDNKKILYDEKGNKRDTVTTENIKEGVGEGADFTELNEALEDTNGKTYQAEINIDKLTTALSNLGVSAEAQQAYIESLEKSGKKFTKDIQVWDANANEGKGGWTTKSITGTYKEVQDQIERETKTADWSGLASEISKTLSSVDVNINGENIVTVLEESIEAADTAITEDQKVALQNSIEPGAKTGVENGVQQATLAITQVQANALVESINSLISQQKIIIPVEATSGGTTKTDKNGETVTSPRVGTPLSRPRPIKTSGPLYPRHARGGSTRTETALVGEEGPELIQIESGGAYLAGTQGPEMIKLHQGDIVYPNDETEEIYRRGGQLLNRYEKGTGPSFNRYETSETVISNIGSGSDKTTEDNTEATEENTKATQDLANVEREQSKLQKQLSELQEGGIYTAPWQLKNLNEQRQLLKKQQKANKEILNQKQEEAKKLEEANAQWDQWLEKNEDGSYSYKEGYDDAVKNGTVDQTTKDNLSQLVSKGNEVADQQTTVDDYAYQVEEIRDQEYQVYADWIDQGVDWTNQVIEGAGQVAQSVLQMIEKVAQSMVDGFKSFLGWLTIRIDDEHDIGELNESLKNRKDLLDWEFDKYAEKDFDYTKGTNSKSQENLFENINDAAQNVLIRLQNQRRLYENSFRQLEDLGTNINSDIEASLEELYEALYGIDGVFTKINDKVQYLENRFERATKWNLTNIREMDPIQKINEWFGTNFEDTLGEALKPLNIFDGTLIDTFFKKSLQQIAGLEITEYRLGNVGESLLQKVANFFYELSPKFDADYQIVNKSELVDALNQKMQTIITNNTITSQFVQNYLDYLTEIESQMESEVDNIRNAESEILSLYDEMTEILEKGKDEYGDLEQQIYDAIVSEKESIKEELEELNDNITDADSELISVLKNNLDQMRQMRENDKTESDLQDKEARLAYLRQDTSGANKQEILKLEKELKEGQQSYTDKLIDQKISELEKQNEEAAEQRQVQIDLLQEEINNTKNIWEKVKSMMDAISGYGSWDDILKGEIKREAYQNIIDQLKKASDFDEMSSFAQDNQINDWGILIRKASLYGTMLKDEYQEAYNDLKILRDILDQDTKLPSDNAADSMWHNYVAFSNLETAVQNNTEAVKNAVSVINRIVDAKTLSFDETGSVFKKATESGATIQALSGLEDAVKNFANDMASGLPSILTQVTSGAGNLAKGLLKGMGAAADSAAGAMTGDIALGDFGEAAGLVMEGVSNFFAAGLDAVSLMCDIIGDTSPGFTDMGVAAGTMIANWLDNAFEEVDDHLRENVGYILNEMYGEEIDGARLGGYYQQIGNQIAEQKEALLQYFDANGKDGEDFVKKLYIGIEDRYKDINDQISKLDGNDIEGFNKQYSRFLALQKILEKIGHTEMIETYTSNSISNLNKWAGEIGSLFAELSEKERQIVVDAINNAIYDVIKDETLASGDPKSSIWESNLKFKTSDIKYYNDIYKEFVDNVNYSVDAIDEAITAINSVFYDPYENEYTSPSAQLLIRKLEQLEGKRAEQEVEFEKSIWETFIDKVSDAWGEFGNHILQIVNAGKSVIEKIATFLEKTFGPGSKWDDWIHAIDNSHALGGAIRQTERALVGELGPELVQHSNGTATIVGRHGPEVTNLSPGDQVYTAEQTKKILRGGGAINFNRFAEGTVGNFIGRAPLLPGLASIDITTPTRALANGQTPRENYFNLNLSLEDLTVDSIERVDEVANRVWDKLNSTISNAMWPYNKL